MCPTGVVDSEMNSGKRGRIRVGTILLLLHCTTFPTVSQEFPYYGQNIEYDYTNRVFALSEQQPLRSILRSDESFLLGTSVIQGYFAAVEDVTRGREPNGSNQIGLERPCNTNKKHFITLLRPYRLFCNLPIVERSCMSEYIIDENMSRALNIPLLTLSTALRNRSTALYKNSKIITKDILNTSPFPALGKTNMANKWSNPAVGMDFSYESTTLKCKINNGVGFRFGEKWYIQTKLTNHPAEDKVRDFERLNVMEYHRLSDDRSVIDLDDALTMSMECKKNLNRNVPIWNTTTTLFLSGGSATPNAFERTFLDQIPSVSAAEDLSSHSAQQVSDALAPSSITILILPLLLNIVPLAALSPHTTSTRAAILYTIATDILSVVPLLAKGIELVVLSLQRHTAAAIRISSDVDTQKFSNASVAELWITECSLSIQTRTWGIVFIVFGVTFMTGGIILEWFLRRKYLKRRLVIKDDDKMSSTIEHPDMSDMSWVRSPITSGSILVRNRSSGLMHNSPSVYNQRNTSGSEQLWSNDSEYMTRSQQQSGKRASWRSPTVSGGVFEICQRGPAHPSSKASERQNSRVCQDNDRNKVG